MCICISELGHHWVACRLFGAKPLPEPMLTYSQLDPSKQTSLKFKSKYQNFLFENSFKIYVVSKVVPILSHHQSLKRKRHQGDSPGVHWGRWRQASTAPVNARAVNLTTFPFMCCDTYPPFVHVVDALDEGGQYRDEDADDEEEGRAPEHAHVHLSGLVEYKGTHGHDLLKLGDVPAGPEPEPALLQGLNGTHICHLHDGYM